MEIEKNRKDNQDLQQVKWMTMKENLELEHKKSNRQFGTKK